MEKRTTGFGTILNCIGLKLVRLQMFHENSFGTILNYIGFKLAKIIERIAMLHGYQVELTWEPYITFGQ